MAWNALRLVGIGDTMVGYGRLLRRNGRFQFKREDVMGEKTMPVTGGCLCGAIRYESTEPPNWVVCCHCRICQQAHGGLFDVGVEFPGEAFRYTKGEVTYYQSSPWAKRGFCANCGSPVDTWYKDNSDPIVHIGSLDHPED